jgi:hypothetical protein
MVVKAFGIHSKVKRAQGAPFGGRKTYSAIYKGFSNERSPKTRLGVTKMHKSFKNLL